MARVLVVADDLTGANATAARFAQRGLRTLTVRSTEDAAAHADAVDVVVVDTDSRHCSGEEAHERVTAACEAVKDVDLVVKRTDTTLRGRIGAEIAAALAVERRRHGMRVRALMVPAFPDAGRTTVGGLQLVDGVPLSDTEVARDPRDPVTRSVVADIVRETADLEIDEIRLDVVLEGPAAVADALRVDADLIVIDAVDRAGIHTIAAAAATLEGAHWMAVDPGPFGPELASALGLANADDGSGPVLVVAGSATRQTRGQIAATERELGARYVDVDPVDPDVEATIDALVELAGQASPDGVVGLRTAAPDEEPTALSAAEATRLPDALGEITAGVLERVAISGLYVTGGDMTLGVISTLGAHGMRIDDEVIPLAVAGTLAGGPHDGLPIATKGGLIGDDQSAVACLDDLRARALRPPRSEEDPR